MRRAFLFAPCLLVACALDPVGARDDDDPGATTGAETGAGAGTSSGPTSSGPTSSGPTSSHAVSGSSSGGATSSGQGGGGSDQGGAGQGGAGQGGWGQGGGGQGGDGGAGQGGQGGAGQGGGGQGGQGGVGGGGMSQGGGGGGGGEPDCGNDVVDPGEECDGPEPECDQATCLLRGACAAAVDVGFEVGGLSIGANTSNAPSTEAFGTCADTGDAATHLYRYTTGPTAAFVQVVVENETLGLADPVLSMHASCFDETITTCFTGDATPPCCTDRPVFQDEELLTGLVQPGTVLTVAVSGYQGDEGAYDITFRDLRFLFLETFEPAPGAFATADEAWGPASGPGCAGGSSCMAYTDIGDTSDGHAMTSTPFSAVGVGGAVLAWRQRLDEPISIFDRYRAQVSIDGGNAWTTVYETGGLEEADPAVAVDFIAGEPDVRLRFVAEADLGDTGDWYVDNVQVIGW